MGWSRGDLAARAHVPEQSVQRLKDGALFSLDSLEAAQATLQAAGVSITASENGGTVQFNRSLSEQGTPPTSPSRRTRRTR